MTGLRYCVAYVERGRERFSPWFADKGLAQRALALLSARHGKAVIIVD
jgi:hypothetical protein